MKAKNALASFVSSIPCLQMFVDEINSLDLLSFRVNQDYDHGSKYFHRSEVFRFIDKLHFAKTDENLLSSYFSTGQINIEGWVIEKLL